MAELVRRLLRLCNEKDPVIPAKAGIHDHRGMSFQETVFMDPGSSPG
jgi:hypothetical protein